MTTISWWRKHSSFKNQRQKYSLELKWGDWNTRISTMTHVLKYSLFCFSQDLEHWRKGKLFINKYMINVYKYFKSNGNHWRTNLVLCHTFSFKLDRNEFLIIFENYSQHFFCLHQFKISLTNGTSLENVLGTSN